MLVNLQEILQDAMKKGYAVPAIDVHNMEAIIGVVETAEENYSPLILSILERDMEFGGKPFIKLAEEAAREARIPVCLHLDHGISLQAIVRAISWGFSSVMIDGSSLPYEENIKLTRNIVEISHAVGVSVEAELGHVGSAQLDGKEVILGGLTDPKLAPKFCIETGIDALAIAIGTAHGVYPSLPQLDFARLAEIKELCPVPLVLHGASGVANEDIQECIRQGIRKVNIATDLRMAMVRGLKMSLEKYPEIHDPITLNRPMLEEVKRLVTNIIHLLGSERKTIYSNAC